MPTTAQGGFGLDLELNGTTIVQVQKCLSRAS